MNKIGFDALLDNMQHFLEFHDVENAVEQKVKEQANNILLTKTMNGGRFRIWMGRRQCQDSRQ